MNPKRFLQLNTDQTLLEMVERWSKMYNLNNPFSPYNHEMVLAIKRMAAELDASGGEHVGEGFLTRDLREILEATNLIRNCGGYFEFTQDFLFDANLNNSNFNALQTLVAEGESEK